MSSTKAENTQRTKVSFLALDKYIDSEGVKPTEHKMRGGDMISWGDGNAYPQYLLSLFQDSTTLHSIIMGCVDYIVGNGVTPSAALGRDGVNLTGETFDELATLLAEDYVKFGGFAIQVIRDAQGGIAELYHVDMRYLRSNDENTVFYYSEDFGSKYTRAVKTDTYAKFVADHTNIASSIFYVKNTHTQVYPTPLYAAAIKDCEIEKAIDTYHLRTINNNFVSSAWVNFNNGIPEDEERKEIERDFNEKYAGAENGGRIALSWSEDKDHETTVTQLKVEDFASQYKALSEHCRQQIFTAFRANPNLFGIPTASGFNSEEYESAFRLFNRTVIRPIQRKIADAFDKIYGMKDCVVFEPFTLD